MPATTLAQRKFSGGEIAPSFWGRVDVEKVQGGLATCRNFQTSDSGAPENRAGFEFIGFTKNAVNPATGTSYCRMVPSIRDITTTYGLEIGHQYCRVWKDGAPVRVAGSPAWSAGTYTPAGTVWAYGGGYWYCIQEAMNATAIAIAISGGPPTYSLLASAPAFNAGMVGQWLAMHFPTATVVFLITAYTSTTQVSATVLSGSFPVGFQAQITTWSMTLAPVAGANWYQLPTTQMEFPTPWADGDLELLHYNQSVDEISFVHQNYAPQRLQRTSDTQWALVGVQTTTPVGPPTGGSAIAGLPVSGGAPAAPTGLAASGGTGSPVGWVVTALTANAESAISVPALATTPSFAHPVTLTWNPVAGATAYAIYREDPSTLIYWLVGFIAGTTWYDYGSTVPGVRAAPGATSLASTEYNYVVTAVDANGFESAASASFGCLGQTAWLTNNPPGQPPNVLAWGIVPGAVAYNVYREITPGSGTYGFIGTATSENGFDDNAITPDQAVQPPTVRMLFNSVSNYPGAVAYFQGRYCFSCTLTQPEYFWFSRVNNFQDYSSYHPGTDADAIIEQINGWRVNPIRHMIDLGALLFFTDNGIFSAQGSNSGNLAPSTINVHQENRIGCSAVLQPLGIGIAGIYLQARGNVIRDVQFSLYTNNFTGTNISRYSRHLFDGYSIISWAYAEVPSSIIWAVRSDGDLLGCTYIPEQQTIGWHRHDTINGIFDDVCVLPEQTQQDGQEDVVYAITQRVVNGVPLRMIERKASRLIVDPIGDPFFVDCGTHYDGRNTSATTLTITGAAPWAMTQAFVLVASAPTFTNAIGAVYALTDAAGDLIHCTVTGYTDAQHVTVAVDENVPLGLQAVAVATWSACATTMTVPQLAGQAVSILGDGYVLSAPDPVSGAPPSVVVPANGVVTLPEACAVVTIGLPITADLLTLDVENPEPEQTFSERTKNVQKVVLRVDGSRSFAAAVVNDDGSYVLERPPQNNQTTYDTAVAAVSGYVDIEPQGGPNRRGAVFLRHTDPVPLRVLSIAGVVTFGDGN